MAEYVCEQCGSLFLAAGDNWYRVERMHGDRVGAGPYTFCGSDCAAEWLAAQDYIDG